MVLARRVGVAFMAGAILVLAACSPDGPSTLPPKPKPTVTYSSYVAMGDSFVAGPGINPVDPVSRGCQRSLNNWPTLLAKELRIPSLEDVSCSGANSVDIYKARTGPTAAQPLAQIDGLSPSTDLVTVGVGGNDEGVFGKVIFACATGTRKQEAVCSPAVYDFLRVALDRTARRVAISLERIRAAAPHARIVLVGYLRVLADPGGCVVTGIPAARTAPVLKAQTLLDASMAKAAEAASVEYISMAQASAGHESCSGQEAWVNGFKSVPGDGAYLHPNAAGMRAIADLVAKRLRQQ